MAEINPLSNLSYTNKDFQDIYPELLNLSKKISYKWDPTVSNESDPGVVLLKLCAIIADKNNYNIDKNVLETFPLSVTQETNARQLFEQLGYRMHWYRSATTNVALRWIGTIEMDAPETYIIKPFTMVADSGNEVVYTLTEQVQLSQNGATAQASAIQGIATEFTINGERNIVPSMLDGSHRLYFTEKNVAENGIFIENADGSMGTETDGMNYHGWRRVDNLSVEPLGKSIYRFGVTRDGRTCYLEFPDDIDELMGQGINITYIKTDGRYGNISAKTLTKFYNDVVVISNNDNEIALTSENVQLTNTESSVGGREPETIDDAYKNYKKTIGTFNTLVTLRDYNNAINSTELISNGFVCDRTNDVQCSYNIVSFDGELTKRVLNVEKYAEEPSAIISSSETVPYMDAFDLKIYALQYVFNPSLNTKSYNNSFNLLMNNENSVDSNIKNTIDYINDVKSIQHDFTPLIDNRICIFKNKYPIECKIIPQQKVTSVQEKSIRTNVLTALYDALNSKEITFGEEIDYDFIYNTVMGADERIKAITLDMPTYTTYAVYSDGNEFKEVNINTMSEQVCGYYNSEDGLFYYDSEFTEQVPFISFKQDSEYIAKGYPLNVAGRTPYDEANPPTWEQFYHYYNTVDRISWTPVLMDSVFTDMSATSASQDKSYTYGVRNFIEDKKTEIQNDIYAKSVLNGNTQFLTPDETFKFALTQKMKEVTPDIQYVTTNADAILNGENTASYEIKENEHIYLYAPNLIDKVNYSTYVKFQFQLGSGVVIDADTDYELQSGESIAFYWKETSDDDAPYTYYKYSEGTIIKPSFRISYLDNADQSIDSYYIADNLLDGKGVVPDETVLTTQYSYNEYLKYKVTDSKNVLTSTKTITIRKVNEARIGTSTPCYWILNKKTDDDRCVLFSENQSEYILQPGEYFFYASLDSAELIILGSGTQLSRSTDIHDAWSVDSIDYSELVEDGADALTNVWFTIPSLQYINIKEMQFISLNAGTIFKVSRSNTSIDLLFNNNGVWQKSEGSSEYDVKVESLSDYNLSYTDDTDTETPIPKINIGTQGWSGKTFLSLNVSPSTPQVLQPNQTIFYKPRNDINYYVIKSDNNESLYLLSNDNYTTDGGSDIEITKTDINGNISYLQLYVYLSTKVTDNPNLAYSKDGTIYVTIDAQSTDTTISREWSERSNEYDEISSLYEWSEDDVYSAVGTEITGVGVTPITLGYPATETSAHYYNSTDQKSYTAIHSAIEYTVTGETPINQSAPAVAEGVAFNSADTPPKAWKVITTISQPLDFLLPDGKYILPLHISEDFDKVSVQLGITYAEWQEDVVYSATGEDLIDSGKTPVSAGISPIDTDVHYYNSADNKSWTAVENSQTLYLYPINSNSQYISKKGIYYMSMNLNGVYNTYDNIVKLTVSLIVELFEGSHKIAILPIMRYGMPIVEYDEYGDAMPMSEQNYKAILHHIINLDTEKLFDYTYIVDEDEVVLNPLQADSFFNSHHIFNKYTIGQMDTSLTNIYIANRLK